MKDPAEYNVRAVERAARILACFDNDSPVLSSSEIAQAVGLHKSTTHRILTTLVHHRLLERASDGIRYRLGLQLADLGFRVIQRMDARREAIPVMTRLRDEWDETCDLSILDTDGVFYVEVIHSTHTFTIAASVGRHLPAHCTASGKLFLAHMSVEDQKRFLERPLQAHTGNTITSPEKLRAQLREIRERGYSVDRDEYEVGICAVSAPIRDQTSRVVAALGMPGPTSRMTPERITDVSAALIEAAGAISRRLGWPGRSPSSVTSLAAR
jgi:IclR family KDG regulon transcriptional repressor